MARSMGEFTRLLTELRAGGPLDRIRLLGRSLSALRRLSPWDRRVLLRMAGFEGAEMLVERLARGEPETAEALGRALAEIEKHPGELQRTVRSLNDPRQRAAAIDELLAVLDRATAHAQEAPGEPEASVDALAEAGAAPEAGAPAAVSIPVPPPPEPPPPPQPPPEPAPEPPEPTPPQPVPSARVEEPRRRETAGAEPVRPHRPPRPIGPLAPVAPLVLAPSDESVAPTGPPLEPLEPRLPDQAPSAVGALECLRQLRRDLAAGRPPSTAELARRLEAELPFPWARRRAIQAWLDAAPPADPGELEHALSLIDALPPGSDRAWCLASLAAARPWRADSWERIASASAGPAGRRRLEARRRHS